MLDAIGQASFEAGWRKVPGSDAPLADRLLDERFTHVIAGTRTKTELWTCRPDLLEKAKAEYVAETRQAAYRELVRKDPVARRVSPAIHDPSDLTDRQSEQVGTRLSSLPSKGWKTRINLEGYWGPPKDFDRDECLTECVWGGVLTHRGLVCTNQTCFDGKVEESLMTPRRSALARRSRRHDERRRRAFTSISELTPQNATDLCVWLLGQGVALGKRVIADPNRYRDHTTRTEIDEEQVEIQRLLGIGDGDPHCSECVWDFRDAQERARKLDREETEELLSHLLAYALYRPLHSWIRLPAPSFLVTSPSVPSVMEVTLTDNGLRADLSNARSVYVRLKMIPWLDRVSRAARNNYLLEEDGRRITWPTLRESITVEALLGIDIPKAHTKVMLSTLSLMWHVFARLQVTHLRVCAV